MRKASKAQAITDENIQSKTAVESSGYAVQTYKAIDTLQCCLNGTMFVIYVFTNSACTLHDGEASNALLVGQNRKDSL